MVRVLVLSLLLSLSGSLFGQSNDWQLKRNKDGIQVYYRDAEDTDVRELKMIYEVKSSLAGVVKLLDNVSDYQKWVYKLAETFEVERLNRTDFYYYNRMDFPWPLSDRDLVGYNRLWQEKETKIVHCVIETAHWKTKEKEELVRIKTLKIKWDLIPLKDGRVRIEYALKSDPAGNIPAWMVNLALEQGPLETVQNMRRELAKPAYQNARLPFIEEL